MKFLSPLRYPGGKLKLYNNVLNIIQDNNLVGCTYIEPFAGGAGIALKLLDEGYVNNIVINDYDRAIYAFWYSVIYRGEELIKLIKKTEVTLEERLRQKEIQKRKLDKRTSLLKLGFSTFFLNRVNRSGIINGGPIGGNKQDGNYKLDCRFNKVNLIERINKIIQLKDKIILECMDAQDLIKLIESRYGKNSFTFIDPPYYIKGSQLYMNYLNHQDHIKIMNSVEKHLNTPYIITYDNCDEIKSIYNNFDIRNYDIRYSSTESKVGTEVLISNQKFKIDSFFQ